MPPDVVCLYSEDRKFLLHGEPLLCAGVRNRRRRTRAFAISLASWSGTFRPRSFKKRSKRLVDRGYVLPASRSSAGAVAAYWASLGLSPETAENNLQNCRVANSIDRRAGCSRARRRSGRPRRSRRQALPRPDSHAGQRLSRRTPGGIEPGASVGPYPLGAGPAVRHFSSGGAGVPPGRERLLDLPRRSHEAQPRDQGASRSRSRPVASPYRLSPGTRSDRAPSSLRRSRSRRRSRADLRTRLRDHIISLDLLGATIVKHYVAARPQCPSCGRKKLRDPRRAPVPIELGAGGKLVMTSGGYRTVSPRATVARFRKHVSPLTGVVSRLERIEADLPLNTNYYAGTQFFGARQDGQRAEGGTERRQLRQGQHGRAGRSQRAHGGDRALFRDFSGRRNQGCASVPGFPVRRCHSSERSPAV